MNLLVILGIVALLVALKVLPRFVPRFRMNMLAWVLAWIVAVWLILELGFETPVPASVVGLYMGIVILALLLYLSSDRERLREVQAPLTRFMTERRFVPYLVLVALLIPAAVAANLYADLTADTQAPGFGRTVHPASPDQILVHEESFNLVTLDNPFRPLESTDPAAFEQHLANGRRVYYENCFFCHGDLMQGKGVFAHGLNPIPTNFSDPNTIPGFQESYLFWRVAKGAPGLPPEGGPWDSAMPAWEKFLSEEEMWDVIAFLYDFTGTRPRARHETFAEEH
jgi:mono/diheme cytochrome c family protein